VVSHYIKADCWSEALTALRKQKDPELYYKFSPVLMQNAPKETVEIWKAAKGRLDPSRWDLLPWVDVDSRVCLSSGQSVGHAEGDHS
jgi:hypothetical protein